MTAVLISIEYVFVKKANIEIPGLDMTAFSWQARMLSVVFLTAILLWNMYKSGSLCKKSGEVFQQGTWGYAAIAGAMMTLSILTFYYALTCASNPGYPSAIKELSLVITLVLAAWMLDKPLLDLDKRVWCGVGLILGGAFLVAKFANHGSK